MNRIIISTGRLSMHLMEEQDRPWYLHHVQQEDIMRFITGRALQAEEAEERFQKALSLGKEFSGFGFMVIRQTVDGAFVGIGKLIYDGLHSAELGYSLELPFWGRGMATEILQGLKNYALNHPQLKILTAIADPGNQISLHILEKAGFRQDGTGTFKGLPAVFLSLALRPHTTQ